MVEIPIGARWRGLRIDVFEKKLVHWPSRHDVVNIYGATAAPLDYGSFQDQSILKDDLKGNYFYDGPIEIGDIGGPIF